MQTVQILLSPVAEVASVTILHICLLTTKGQDFLLVQNQYSLRLLPLLIENIMLALYTKVENSRL